MCCCCCGVDSFSVKLGLCICAVTSSLRENKAVPINFFSGSMALFFVSVLFCFQSQVKTEPLKIRIPF